MNYHLQLQQAFTEHFGNKATDCYFSPGRVNLIGEHIDYNGGYVLPAAISLGIYAAIHKRNDQLINIYAADYKEAVSFNVDEEYSITAENTTHWSDYIKATLQVLKDNQQTLFGADIYLKSNLPIGAGLSSSAALECLIAFIFNENYYLTNKIQLAVDAQLAEQKYVGVNCGIMDQFAVANGKKDYAMLLNCSNLAFEYIPANFGNYTFVIINSNKARSLAASKYNERRKECDAAFDILKTIDIATDLCNVHEISLSYLEDDILYQRAKHAVLENKRVLLAVEALEQNNMEAFGQLLTESHISLDTDYEVSCYELNMIVHYSTHFDGCIGARMTGAGFGGSCIALVQKDRIKQFISYVGKKYTEKTSLVADFYEAEISNSVHKIIN